MRERIKKQKKAKSSSPPKRSSTPLNLNERGIRQKRQLEEQGLKVKRKKDVLQVFRGEQKLFEAKGREDLQQLEDTKINVNKNVTQLYHTYQIGVAPKRETPRGPHTGPAYDTGIFKPEYSKNRNNKQIILTLTGYKKGYAPMIVTGQSASFRDDAAYDDRFEGAKQSALKKLPFTPDDIRIESVQVREIVENK